MPTLAAVDCPNVERSRLGRWSSLLGRFLAGQLANQAITLITGLLLLRFLSVEQYARFGVAFAFQSTIALLVDVGFSNSIVALVGHRGSDPHVIGGFIRAAQHYRNRMFVFIGIAAIVAFPLVTYRQTWGPEVKAALLAAILSSVFLQRQMMYGAPLLIHRRLVQYYSAQFAAAVARLALVLLLYKLRLLSAVAAAWLTTLTIALNGFMYRHHAKLYVHEPETSDPGYNREMIRLIMPLAPGIVFYAFQGQIAVGLITIFGTTRNIAEVSALGRLAQLFAIFGAANSVLIEPYIARLPRPLLPRRYALFGLSACAVALAVTLIAFAFPTPLLLLLGSKYRNLRPDIGWAVAASCLSYAASVFWIMNSARKFVYWWYTIANIAAVLISQIVCVCTMDLSTTRNVIYFILIGNAATFLVHIAGGVSGIYRSRASDHAAPSPKTSPVAA